MLVIFNTEQRDEHQASEKAQEKQTVGASVKEKGKERVSMREVRRDERRSRGWGNDPSGMAEEGLAAWTSR